MLIILREEKQESRSILVKKILYINNLRGNSLPIMTHFYLSLFDLSPAKNLWLKKKKTNQSNNQPAISNLKLNNTYIQKVLELFQNFPRNRRGTVKQTTYSFSNKIMQRQNSTIYRGFSLQMICLLITNLIICLILSIANLIAGWFRFNFLFKKKGSKMNYMTLVILLKMPLV